jgi:hypothetical protein
VREVLNPFHFSDSSMMLFPQIFFKDFFLVKFCVDLSAKEKSFIGLALF